VKKESLILYAVTSIIMAAKMEQPLTPSINLMLNLLTNAEREIVTKRNVIALEEKVLTLLNCNLLFLGPLQFLERYLRLSNFHENEEVVKLASEIIIMCRTKIQLAEFKPSQIAAASFFLAVWKVH